MARKSIRNGAILTAVGLALGIAVAPVLQPAAKSVARTTAPGCHQSYPNIKGKVLLENDKVVVQRFVFPPGVWEGVHAHPPDQLYVHIRGGTWKVRHGTHVETGFSETGSVGWYGPVPLSADHESVNVGKEPIDLIWVTLKTGCQNR